MTQPQASPAHAATGGSDTVARLLRPRSIAILGASPERGSIGGGVLANLEDFGYSGEIHLVSRSRDNINGRPCVKSIADLPRGIDVAVLIVPFAAIRASVIDCIAQGVGAIVIYTSGFAEASEDGRRQQEELADLCRDAGVALLGPNCMGYTNYVDGIPLTFEPVTKTNAGSGGRVAIIAQSGATAANIRFAMQAREIPIAHVVATGNEALLSAEDFIDYSLGDDGIAAIAVYVEQVRDPARFLSVARKARAQGKPVVMLHPGSSERGRKAAESHTGALAGNHAVMQAAARNEAVVVVDTLDEMFDVLAILVRFPVPPPGKAGIVTNSGAIRGLAFDFCEKVGLELAPLSPEVKAELTTQVPEYVHVDNPFDVGTTGFANPGIFGTSAEAMLKDPGIGMILSAHAGGSPVMQVKKSDYLVPVYQQAKKPILFCIIGDDYALDAQFMRDVRDSGIPFFRSPERAMRAMKVVSDYANALAALEDRSEAQAPSLDLPAGGALTEHAGKAILRDLGLRCPAGALVQDLDGALRVAGRIGYPVVIKAQAKALSHKSDAGAVIINLRDEAALKDGWDTLHANLAKAAPGVALDGVLVEEMAAPGLELVVGARRDPDWGPVLLVGLGGVWIEVLKDSRLMPPDISHARAVAEIHKLKAAKLLEPFRGQPARDVSAVADAVVALGALMRANPQIAEIDINPLVVYAEGEGVIALDALIVTQ
ncbi:acetate--CoA ligase family protein [Rhodobacter sp. NTK016B]|uniref:acetate--CoA ligase family protein n=1 Tax=Rhodobacter sp. NTK016B TaxID=2759676 RepID=UPI001A90400E|nr:acetate--CoA ligase family protein [Rhodobacter sp. NTK016B]MBN8293282.1 acetate--CoA ligase family protein [Rhodobacter sp. NTK016B]